MSDPKASAGSLLRDARQRAGLTQQQLAAAADITQSVLSAYERGRREPSFATLTRLIAATGCDIDVVLHQSSSDGAPVPGRLARLVRERGPDIKGIAARHGFSNIRLFGSVARGEERAGSDIDLLVDPPAGGVGLLGLARLQRDLEDFLGARVEIVIADELRPAVADSISRELVPL